MVKKKERTKTDNPREGAQDILFQCCAGERVVEPVAAPSEKHNLKNSSRRVTYRIVSYRIDRPLSSLRSSLDERPAVAVRARVAGDGSPIERTRYPEGRREVGRRGRAVGRRAGGVRAVAARWWAKPLPAEPLSAVEAPPKAGAVRAARGANGCFVGGMRGLCTDLQATRETSSEELVSARYGELM